MKKYRNSPRAFSLIELLVVIAVLAILAAILVPAASKVRSSALRVETVSNLQQLGSAFKLYAAENTNRLPYAYQANSPANGRNFTNWMQELALNGYLGAPDFPDDNAEAINIREFSVLGSPLQRIRNPGTTTDVGAYNTFSANYGVLNGNFQSSKTNPQTSVYNLLEPAKTLLICEGSTHGTTQFNLAIYPANLVTYPNYLYDEKVSVLFADGHVSTILLSDFPASAGPRYSSSWHFWRGRE